MAYEPPTEEPHITCPNCGLQNAPGARFCANCGLSFTPGGAVPVPTLVTVQVAKSRTTAGILALFLGGLGVHKFYLGQGGLGFLYLIFCCTLIPSLVSIVDAIILFSMSDADFQAKYGIRP